MEFQINQPITTDISYLTLSAPGAVVGATVSAVVFTTLTTTGEIVASATSSGIELTGNILAYGTELAVGTLAANNIRNITRTCGALAKPAITNSSRIGALGLSLLAGTSAAFTTSALIYGGKQVKSYLYSCYEDYKQNIVNKIQYPVSVSSNIVLVNNDEYDIQIIEDEPSVELVTVNSKHSPLD